MPLMGLLVALCCVLMPGDQEPQIPEYAIPVTVVDNKMRPVPSLSLADVQVMIGGVATPALAVEPDPRPVSMVIIVDGMEQTDALFARSMLTDVLKVLRKHEPGVRVGLMLGIGGATAPTMALAQEAAATHDRQISRFFRSEVTAVPQDTLLGAIDALRREETQRRVVLMLSVNRRQERLQIPPDLVRAARLADVTVAMLEASGPGRGQDQALWLIHSSVGGYYSRLSDVSGMAGPARLLATALLQAWTVTFRAAGSGAQELRIETPALKGTRVIAPAWATRR